MISKKTKNILYAILIIGIISFAIYQGNKNSDELKADHTITIAKITSMRPAKKGRGTWVTYEFLVGNATYTHEEKCEDLTTEEGATLHNKNLPLIYATKNPTNHHLLVNENQFAFYNIPVPDSLKPLLRLLDHN